jgi:hypothetical protein
MMIRLRSTKGMPASPASVARGLRFARWIVAVVCLGFACFGAAFIGIGIFDWTRAADSASWPTVQGTVIESRVVVTTSTRKGRTQHSHSARMVYRYEVDGREYEAHRLSFRVHMGGEDAAQETVAAYPVGARVDVRHSPADPSLACLVPGTDAWQALPLGVGALAIAFAGGLWWFALKSITRRLANIAAAA